MDVLEVLVRAVVGLVSAVVLMGLLAAAYLTLVDPGALGRRKKLAKKPEVRELDFSGKRTRLEREREEWMADFFVALGADRESFVRQWSGGSERLVLAQSLREDYEEAVANGWKFRAEVLNGLRHKVTAYPEKELSSKKLADIRALQEELKERHLLSYETASWRY